MYLKILKFNGVIKKKKKIMSRIYNQKIIYRDGTWFLPTALLRSGSMSIIFSDALHPSTSGKVTYIWGYIGVTETSCLFFLHTLTRFLISSSKTLDLSKP